MKKSVWTIVVPAITLLFIAGFLYVRRPFTVPVTLFYDERDLAGAVVSKQALQSVVLAMEFFNSRSSEFRFLPFRETDQDIYESIEHAAARGSVAIVGGINAPFASLLADSSRRHGIPFLSLASGTSLARSDDFVFRARPRNGGKELGLAAKSMGVSSYSVIVSGTTTYDTRDNTGEHDEALLSLLDQSPASSARWAYGSSWGNDSYGKLTLGSTAKTNSLRNRIYMGSGSLWMLADSNDVFSARY